MCSQSLCTCHEERSELIQSVSQASCIQSSVAIKSLKAVKTVFFHLSNCVYCEQQPAEEEEEEEVVQQEVDAVIMEEEVEEEEGVVLQEEGCPAVIVEEVPSAQVEECYSAQVLVYDDETYLMQDVAEEQEVVTEVTETGESSE